MILIVLLQSSQYPLKPSVNLKSRAAKEWLIEMNDLEENFIDLILALTHPSLFKAGVEAYERRESEIPSESHNIMHSWRSVFSGIAVIVNRKSARHTDRGGRRHWYDLLISAGNPARPVLKLPQLGAKITYTAGTVVLLCGKSIEHEVGDWGAGDRICLAHFMRDNVFRRLGVDHAEWSLLPAIVDRVKRGNLDTD